MNLFCRQEKHLLRNGVDKTDHYIQKGTPEYRRAISALLLGSLATFGLIYGMQPLIPNFSQEFGLTPSVASLTMSFTTAGMAVSMLAIAFFAGFLNRKLTMAIALLGTAILSFVAVFCPNFTAILFGRALQGILVAGFPAIAVAYVNEEFDPEITGLVTGIYISGTSIGGLSGRLLASTLTDFFSWKIALGCIGSIGLLIGIWFCISLPKSKHFVPQKHLDTHIAGTVCRNIRNKMLFPLYLIAFSIMGSFIAVYNFIGYPLMAPPYNLSQTAIGGLFTIYLIGTFSSTFMGGMADRFGNTKILFLSICLMLAGGLLTLGNSLIIKIIGLSLFTFGFFASHSAACSGVGKCCLGDKAQAASLYFLFYYIGASVVGTIGGVFLSSYDWKGVIFLIGTILLGSLLIAGMLILQNTRLFSASMEKIGIPLKFR